MSEAASTTWLVPMVWRVPKRRTVDVHGFAVEATSAEEAGKKADDRMFLTYFFRVPELPVVRWHRELGAYNGPQKVKEQELLSLRDKLNWRVARP